MATHSRFPALHLVLGATLALPLLSGCASGPTADNSFGSVAAVPPGAPLPGQVDDNRWAGDIQMSGGGSIEAGMAGGGGMIAENPQSAAKREVITTGYISLTSPDPLATASRVAELVNQAGGFIESRNESRAADGNPGNAFLSIRVPAAGVTGLVDQLGDIGAEVRNVEINRQDVTAQGADLDARIAALQTSTERLLNLMDSAANVEDLLRAERELSSRQAELDSLRAIRASLSDQVAMSQLNISIGAPTSFTQPRSGFLDALLRGWESLLVSGRWLIVALGTLLPWLAVAALLWWGVRRLLRAWRARKPAAHYHRPTTHEVHNEVVPPETEVFPAGQPYVTTEIQISDDSRGSNGHRVE